MASPFQQLANLTVVFSVPTAAPVLTNNVGNPTLITTDLVCVAYAVQQRVQRRPEALQDGELSRIFYRGFWVLPMQAPQTIRAEQIGPALLWRLAPDFALPVEGWPSVDAYQAFVEINAARITGRGDFVLAPNPADPYGYMAQTGDVFEGYLQALVAWGDVL